MIRRFAGVNISTRDTGALTRFYSEKLGIPLVGKGFDNYDGAQIGFDHGQPVIFIWDEGKWGRSSEGAVNLVFMCDDLEATYEELRSKGVELDPPVTADWGGKELRLVDPAGNKLTLLA